MAGEISFACTINKDAVPVLNQPQVIYALFEMAPTGKAAQARMGLNFSLVLDRSGSMDGEKISRLREAVKQIIDQLEPSDYVSVVAFNNRTDTLVPSTLAQDKAALKRKVQGLSADASTEMAPALRAGLAEVKKQRREDRVSRLVVLTDGHPTDNLRDSLQMAETASREGIPIIALGLGDDWNTQFLTDLSAKSGPLGQVVYIARPEDTAQIFQDVLQSMQIVAKDVTLTLRLVQGVTPRRVWQVVPLIKDLGYSPLSDRFVEVRLGDLEQQGVAILAELSLQPRNPGRYRIAQSEVSYNVPVLKLTGEKVQADIMMGYTPDAYALPPQNPKVANMVERVTAFNLQTRALEEAAAGNVAGATQKLRGAVTILLSQQDEAAKDLAKTLKLEADRLEQGGELSEAGKKTIALSRKTVKLSDL